MLFMRNVTAPESGIRHKEENAQLYVEQNLCGTGTLFIAESCLCWINTSGEGLSFEYPSICLHAISRDTTNAFHQPCIYMQVGMKLDTGEQKDDDESSDEGQGPDEDTDPCTVLRLVPQNDDSLQAMFDSLSECQALHPDPDDSDQETEYFNSAGDASGLSSRGLITLQRLEGMLQGGHEGAGAGTNGDAHNGEGDTGENMDDGDHDDEAMDDQ